MKTALSILLLLACQAQAQTSSQPPSPERKVNGRTVASINHPAISLQASEGFRYLGSQRFQLYGVVDAEQHFFIDVKPDGLVQKLIWILKAALSLTK